MDTMTTAGEIILMIENGDYDKDLVAISTAAQKRNAELARTRYAAQGATAKMIPLTGEFTMGQRVRFNQRCGTQYLRGAEATIVGKKRVKYVVRLDHPVGRFKGDVIVPVEIIDAV